MYFTIIKNRIFCFFFKSSVSCLYCCTFFYGFLLNTMKCSLSGGSVKTWVSLTPGNLNTIKLLSTCPISPTQIIKININTCTHKKWDQFSSTPVSHENYRNTFSFALFWFSLIVSRFISLPYPSSIRQKPFSLCTVKGFKIWTNLIKWLGI